MELKDKNGRLTDYGFSCGYVERETRGNVEVSLYKEHSTFHVRAHNFEAMRRIFWDSFRTLTEARARYARALKEAA